MAGHFPSDREPILPSQGHHQGSIPESRDVLSTSSVSQSYGSNSQTKLPSSESGIQLESKGTFTVEERDVWNNKTEYLLSLVGCSVGLPNIWRFPYLAQKNGGGAFLIPYVFMVFIAGVPLFYLELALGQRFRKGCISVWNEISPYFGGVGICSCVVSIYVTLYYSVTFAWCLVYLAQSFQSPLPWSRCPETQSINGSYTIVEDCQKSGPTSYFWYSTTLQQSPSLDYIPEFNWQVACGLLGSWVIIYLFVIRGIKSAGKLVYFTGTYPYIVLVVFLIRSVTLEGYQLGLKRMFIPEWSKLADGRVWLTAASHTFYSYGLGFGSIISLASYNPVKNNFFRDTALSSAIDIITNIMGCIIVFCILGFRATQEYAQCLNETPLVNITTGHLSNSEVVTPACDLHAFFGKSASGIGLVFIVFTNAIDLLPVSPIWAVLFFLMVITLCVDTIFVTLEGVITGLHDAQLLPKGRKEIVVGGICFILLLASTIFSTSTGPYLFELFDNYSANISIVIVGFLEVIAIAYVYGLRQISEDIHLMLGRKTSLYWLLSWRFVMPLALSVLFVSSLVGDFTQGIHYTAWDPHKARSFPLLWPWWCQLIAAILVLSAVLWIPALVITTKCGWSVLRPETPGPFPREKLREERGLVSDIIPEARTSWFL